MTSWPIVLVSTLALGQVGPDRVVPLSRLAAEFPSIEEIRSQRKYDMDCLDSGIKRIVNPHIYHVSLSDELWNLKDRLAKSSK